MSRFWRIAVRNSRASCALALAVALAATFAAPAARADSVQLLSTGSMLSTGRQTWSTELDIQSAGVLTMTVHDMGVASTIIDRLSSLSFNVSTPSGVLAGRSGSGWLSFDITSPGLYFLNIAATPNMSSPYKFGLVSWNAIFEPASAVVPLPPAAWLLLAGFAWAIGLQRRRAKLASGESGDFNSWDRSLAPAH